MTSRGLKWGEFVLPVNSCVCVCVCVCFISRHYDSVCVWPDEECVHPRGVQCFSQGEPPCHEPVCQCGGWAIYWLLLCCRGEFQCCWNLTPPSVSAVRYKHTPPACFLCLIYVVWIVDISSFYFWKSFYFQGWFNRKCFVVLRGAPSLCCLTWPWPWPVNSPQPSSMLPGTFLPDPSF